jgi:hypothetical protein
MMDRGLISSTPTARTVLPLAVSKISRLEGARGKDLSLRQRGRPRSGIGYANPETGMSHFPSRKL